MGEQPDDLLVERARQGDIEAFGDLAIRYHKRIYHMILALTNDPCDADDLAQETFMHAFRSMRSFKGRSSFYTWLYRIAVNLTWNSLKKKRKEKNRKEVLSDDHFAWESVPAAVSSPEADSLRRELRRKLKEAIDALPFPYRTAFILVEFHDLPHEEAARVLGCSENTVSWRMHQARKMLQARLRPYLERGIK